MTDQERRVLRLAARRVAAMGLDCNKPGCPHQDEAANGAKCPRLAECVAANRELQEFGRGGDDPQTATTAGDDPQISQITQIKNCEAMNCAAALPPGRIEKLPPGKEIAVRCGNCERLLSPAEGQNMLEGAACPGCGRKI